MSRKAFVSRLKDIESWLHVLEHNFISLLCNSLILGEKFGVIFYIVLQFNAACGIIKTEILLSDAKTEEKSELFGLDCKNLPNRPPRKEQF